MTAHLPPIPPQSQPTPKEETPIAANGNRWDQFFSSVAFEEIDDETASTLCKEIGPDAPHHEKQAKIREKFKEKFIWNAVNHMVTLQVRRMKKFQEQQKERWREERRR